MLFHWLSYFKRFTRSTNDAKHEIKAPTFSLSRHDHHNLEIKTASSIEGQSYQFLTSLYLFMPYGLQLHTQNKTKIIDDFRSNIRLSFPVDGPMGTDALSAALNRFQLIHKQFFDVNSSQSDALISQDALFSEDLIEVTKELGSLIAEILSSRKRIHRKLITKQAPLAQISSAITDTASLLTQARQRIFNEKKKCTLLNTLDEYVSQLYVRYLAKMRSLIEVSHQDLLPLVDSLLQEENVYLSRRTFMKKALDSEHHDGQGLYLTHLSILKKFFQSTLFIGVTYRDAVKKFSEPVAALGATAAAVGVTFLERLSHDPSTLTFAYGSMYLMSGAVVFYVLRDRLKDQFRNQIFSRIKKYVPDVDRFLYARHQKIGQIREWFRVLPRQQIPRHILKMRRASSTSVLEHQIPEDVLCYRSLARISLSSLGHSIYNWGIRRSTRINLQRYLKYMDDPFKKITLLDENGHLIERSSHKVYHLYALLECSIHVPTDVSENHSQYKVFRITMDKNGIHELTSIPTPVAENQPLLGTVLTPVVAQSTT